MGHDLLKAASHRDAPATAADVSRFVQSDAEGWHNLNCQMFSKSEPVIRPVERFNGSLKRTDLGASRLSRIDASPLGYLRTHREITHDPTDGFVVMMILKGEVRLTQREIRVTAMVGEALIYRHGRPFDLDFPDAYSAVTLWIPTELMRVHCPDIGNQAPFVLRRGSGNSRLALRLFEDLSIVAMESRVHDTARLVGATLDVVSTAFPVAKPDKETGSRRLLIGRLQDYLRRNIDDPDVTLDSLVAVSGMSARSLNRIFAREATTPMRWVWSQRLDASYTALLQSRVHSVTEATFAFGFKDTSHFSRAFRARFGFSPSDLLNRN